MADQNPFLAPDASPRQPPPGEPRALDAGRGIEWLRQGWQIFLANPGMWIAISVVWLVIFVVLNFVPLVGHLAIYFLTPVFTAGALLGCRDLKQGGELRLDHLFAGFRNNTGNLVMIGVLSAVAALAIALLALAIIGGGAISGAAVGHMGGAGMAAGGLTLGLLVGLALNLPLAMALWFAPALVAFDNRSPLDAMKLSFSACLRNMVPFLVYGVLGLVLAFLASLPFGLGWLVLLPVLVGSIHASYAEIFG